MEKQFHPKLSLILSPYDPPRIYREAKGYVRMDPAVRAAGRQIGGKASLTIDAPWLDHGVQECTKVNPTAKLRNTNVPFDCKIHPIKPILFFSYF
ncbi:MAG: hypothetical protein K2X02_07290 [Alphaproteobacteria bacterium]|nr:hypothetical protein [Alphaproteobacteria bacterium]